MFSSMAFTGVDAGRVSASAPTPDLSTRSRSRRRSLRVVLLAVSLTLAVFAVFAVLVASAVACVPMPAESNWEGRWEDGLYEGTWVVHLKTTETSPGEWRSEGPGVVTAPYYGELPGQLEATATCTGAATDAVTSHWTDRFGDNTTATGNLVIGDAWLESGSWSGQTIRGFDGGEWKGAFFPTHESGGKVKGDIEVESSPGTLINSLHTELATELPQLPGGALAPVGGVSFAASLPAGATVKVKLTLPPGSHPTGLLKFINAEYIEVPATIAGETVEFEITDGGPFDEDHVVNGEVIDPIIPVSGLQVETTSLPEATRGTAYSATLAVSGGTAPYKWKKVGKLPKGLKLSKEGVLSGTPSTKLAPGAYQVNVVATDSTKKLKRSGTATFTLTVN